MGTKVVGNINVALVFGLLQFVSTFVIAWLYSRYRQTPSSTRWPTTAPRRPASTRSESQAMSHADPHHHRCSSLVVALTLGITIWASRQTKTATDFYAGGRSFSGFQNGLAIGGDYMSAASFLGISGAIALYGYDGFLYSIGFLVAWLVALLLVAELLRNSGRYTMADELAFRMRQRPVRTAAAISTIVVSIFYLLAQMVGAGALVALLLGVDEPGGQERRDRRGRRADDLLRHRRRHEGHHLGADRQGRAADGRHAADHVPGAGEVQLQPVRPCSARPRRSPARARPSSQPGLQYGNDADARKIDFLSLGLALVLGTAGLPHILIRFYTVPDRPGRPQVGALGDRPDRRRST